MVDRVPKNEVLLSFNVMKMVDLPDPIPLRDMVVSFDLKMMRDNLKFPRCDPQSMHLVPKCV
jgi:hypothetical protein